MKIYGHDNVTILPTNPVVGRCVFLSADGLVGALLYYDGTNWISLETTKYARHKPQGTYHFILNDQTTVDRLTWGSASEPISMVPEVLPAGTVVTVLVDAITQPVVINNTVGMAFVGGSLALTMTDVELSSLLGINGSVVTSHTTIGNLVSMQVIGANTLYYPHYNHELTAIDAPGITEILVHFAFANNSSLQTVVLQNCINITGENVFTNLPYLQTVTLPQVLTLAPWTFGNCETLQTIFLPVCTSIGVYAFNTCIALHEVNLPNCVSVGDYAFQGCFSTANLYPRTIYLPSVTAWGVEVFDSVVGTTVTLTIKSGQETNPAVVQLLNNNTITLVLV
jgi:hypothetical protein